MRTLCLLAIFTAGCSTTDSSDVLTSGMYAAITASAPGSGSTQVSATLYLGNPLNLNFVDLTGDDRLVATHDGEEHGMTESIILNIVSHTTTFTSDNEGDEFDVAFLRTIDDGAPSSVAVLPAKFDLDPPVTTTVSRASALTVSWSGPQTTDIMRWEVRGDCIELETQELSADTGSFTIEANRIVKRMGDGIADTCPMTLAVTRARPGDIDPGYGEGGWIEGQQIRTLDLTSTP